MIGGTYLLREGSEAYAGDFAGESDLLTPGNAIHSQRNAENYTDICVVRPVVVVSRYFRSLELWTAQ